MIYTKKKTTLIILEDEILQAEELHDSHVEEWKKLQRKLRVKMARLEKEEGYW